MSTDLKKVEKSVNTIVGKPVAYAIYGLILGVRYGWHGLRGCGSWLRNRYTTSFEKA